MPNLVTLSTLGVTKNPNEAAIRLIKYYNESKPSQSTTFFGKVPNIAIRIMEDGNNPERLSQNIKDDLTQIFNEHFQSVEINVKPVDNNDGTFDVHVSGTFSYKGMGYKLDEKYVIQSENM